jgi:hypothetical protein
VSKSLYRYGQTLLGWRGGNTEIGRGVDEEKSFVWRIPYAVISGT